MYLLLVSHDIRDKKGHGLCLLCRQVPPNVVDTQVSVAPSPRRLGKKKVKLNPVHSVIRGGGNCSPETHYPTKGYDKQSFVVPVVQNDEKVTVIGGKQAISCTLKRKSTILPQYFLRFKLRPCTKKFSPSLSLKKSPRTLAMPDFVLNLLHKTPKKRS